MFHNVLDRVFHIGRWHIGITVWKQRTHAEFMAAMLKEFPEA